MAGIASVGFPENEVSFDLSVWSVSPHDYEQDTLIVWLMSKYAGVFGLFSSKIKPSYVAIFSHRVSDERLAEFTHL